MSEMPEDIKELSREISEINLLPWIIGTFNEEDIERLSEEYLNSHDLGIPEKYERAKGF